MKTLLLILTLTTGLLYANANTDWVDGQIKAIKPPRSGVAHAAIDSVKNPFVFEYAKTQSSKGNGAKTAPMSVAKPTDTATATKALKLAAVINNSALINGEWYQLKDKVQGYSLEKVETDSVLLVSGTTKKMLFVTEANPNIKIQIK